MKKMIAASLACLMAVSPVLAAEAQIPEIPVPSVGDQEARKGENNVPVTLDVLRQNKPIVTFSVTVPTSLPLVMDLSGNVKTATNAQVKNNSTEDVTVTDVNITAADGWTLVPYTAEIKDELPDTKYLGMEINTCKTDSENLLFDQEKFPIVKAKNTMPVTYNALIPRQKKSGNVGTVANSVFIIGWTDPTVEDPLTDLTDKPVALGTEVSTEKMSALCSEKTGAVKIMPTAYAGPQDGGNITDLTVANDGTVVAVTEGENVTIYGEGGIKFPDGTTDLFSGYSCSELDISGLDISNQTSLNSYFSYMTNSPVIVGLDKLDTSHVKDMYMMFAYSWLGSDLTLPFDTSKVENFESMFMEVDMADHNLDVSSFTFDNATTTFQMFHSFGANRLTLGHINAPNLMTSAEMFYDLTLTTPLNISTFETAHIPDMNRMFCHAILPELDISALTVDHLSYDTTMDMFKTAEIGTVYCKSLEEAEVLKATPGCDVTNFVVKTQNSVNLPHD